MRLSEPPPMTPAVDLLAIWFWVPPLMTDWGVLSPDLIVVAAGDQGVAGRIPNLVLCPPANRRVVGRIPDLISGAAGDGGAGQRNPFAGYRCWR